MQYPENVNLPLPTLQEMEIYRYLAATGGTGGGGVDGCGGGLFGNLPSGLNNNYYAGFGGGINNGFGGGNYTGSSCSSFYPSAGVITDATNESKAIAASRVLHKEAEKRRRERINSHLDCLRSLLPCTSKTDKATLLSKVVQRVLELKRQTSHLLDELPNYMIPSETDEFSVYVHNDDQSSGEDDDGDETGRTNDDNNNSKVVLKAMICCDDRPDLFVDLNQALSSLNLKTLRAEISTLGGRIQGVLLVTGDDQSQSDDCLVYLKDALKGVVQRSSSDERFKRRRRAFEPNC